MNKKCAFCNAEAIFKCSKCHRGVCERHIVIDGTRWLCSECAARARYGEPGKKEKR